MRPSTRALFQVDGSLALPQSAAVVPVPLVSFSSVSLEWRHWLSAIVWFGKGILELVFTPLLGEFSTKGAYSFASHSPEIQLIILFFFKN